MNCRNEMCPRYDGDCDDLVYCVTECKPEVYGKVTFNPNKKIYSCDNKIMRSTGNEGSGWECLRSGKEKDCRKCFYG